MRPLNVAVLGATGSIGRQTLDVIDRYPDRFKLFGLTEGARASDHHAEHVVHGQAGEADFDLRVEAMVTDARCDLVVVAIPGARALAPTLAALRAGKEVALATKEVLVMAGDLVMKAAARSGRNQRLISTASRSSRRSTTRGGRWGRRSRSTPPR